MKKKYLLPVVGLLCLVGLVISSSVFERPARRQRADARSQGTQVESRAQPNSSDAAVAGVSQFTRERDAVIEELQRVQLQMRAHARFQSGNQTWEGKPKGQLTEEEREIIGATPIGYYGSRQIPRWAVVHTVLHLRGETELAKRVETVRDDLLAATMPYAKYDVNALLKTQRELISDIEPLGLDLRAAGFEFEQIAEINQEFSDDQESFFAIKAQYEVE